MRRLLVMGLLSLGLAAPMAPIAFHSASAQDLELNIGKGGPKLRMRDDRCDPRVDDDCGPPPPSRRFMRGCTEDAALDKAERMGLRRARVTDSDRNSIDVAGRDRRGNRVELTFGRDRGCPMYN